MNLCNLGKARDNTDLLCKSGPSFVPEVILLEMSTKPDLESVSTLRVRAASGRDSRNFLKDILYKY